MGGRQERGLDSCDAVVVAAAAGGVRGVEDTDGLRVAAARIHPWRKRHSLRPNTSNGSSRTKQHSVLD